MNHLAVKTVIFLIFAIPLSVCDARTMRVPSWLSYCATAALLGYGVLFDKSSLLQSAAGCAALVSVLIAVRAATKNGLGAGDVKFGLPCGVYGGFPGALAGCAIAAMLGLLFFCTIKIQNRKSNTPIYNRKIPFIPFMTIGTLIGTIICISR